MPEPQFRHIRCNLERDVLVIAIAEKQVQGDELADALRREFFQAVEHDNVSRVVVDFAEVQFLGSAGFRPLLSLYRRLRDQGGSLLFCHLRPEVAEVFQITRLISTSGSYPAPFETAPSLEEAVRRLTQSSSSPS